MDGQQFRREGKEMVDLIVDYIDSFRHRPVVPAVKPHDIRRLLPREPPAEGEEFENVRKDIESHVFAGITNWHHPQFHAYYPTANSYPALLGDMLSDAIGCIGFSWIASPACTELEMVMTDWLAKALCLPSHFLFGDGGGKGGGVIQGSASEASLMAILAARDSGVKAAMEANPGWDKWEALSKLVAYTSEQSHSSVERAAKLAFVRLRALPTDSRRALRGDTLRLAIEEDKKKGLLPVLCLATLGTTASCAFDNLEELGPVCSSHSLWLHVDAAYAGAALLCPELRHIGRGLEFTDSFNFNAHKWMQVTFDCSLLWLKDSSKLAGIFDDSPEYLKHEFSGLPEYRNWQIPLGRRFRSLKIWFVMRCFGIKGLQQHVRKQVSLAKEFEQLMRQDGRFEIVEEVVLGLVCFRLKDDNAGTERLFKRIREDNRIHLVSSRFTNPETFFIRFVVCSQFMEEKDVRFAYDVISELTNRE